MPEYEGIPEVYEFIFVRRGRVVDYGILGIICCPGLALVETVGD
jgi:hypothetical protein